MTDWDLNTTFTARMKDRKPLSFEDFVDMLEWIKKTYGATPLDIMKLRVAVQLDETLAASRKAFDKFESVSRLVSTVLIILTFALVVLTAALAGPSLASWGRWIAHKW